MKREKVIPSWMVVTLMVVSGLVSARGHAADDQLHGLGFPPDAGVFAVVGGKPYLLRKGEEAGPGNAVDLASNQRLVHYQSKMPLAYPVDGPEPVVVVLGAGKGVSDQWELKQLTEQRPGGPITATTGKFQGWYLDVSDEECELTVNQKTVHGRPLILVKKPTTTKKFTKFPVAK